MSESDPYWFDVLAAQGAFENREFSSSYWQLVSEHGRSLPGVVAVDPNDGGLALVLEDNLDMDTIREILDDFGAETYENTSTSWVERPGEPREETEYTYLGWYDEDGEFVNGLLEPSREIRTGPLDSNRHSPSTGDVVLEYLERKYG